MKDFKTFGRGHNARIIVAGEEVGDVSSPPVALFSAFSGAMRGPVQAPALAQVELKQMGRRKTTRILLRGIHYRLKLFGNRMRSRKRRWNGSMIRGGKMTTRSPRLCVQQLVGQRKVEESWTCESTTGK
mgnify:CR=1 FL=1